MAGKFKSLKSKSLACRMTRRMGDAFKVLGGATPHFEAASQSRRMRGFNPSKNHINRAIEAAGETIVARSRWLYDNEPIYGSAVDEWVSAVVSDGIKPHPRIKGNNLEKKALLNLWWQWVDEVDYESECNFYGMQETVAREVFMALNERGYDREDIDAEIADERGDAGARGLIFDTDMAGDPSSPPVMADEPESNQGAEAHEGNT